MMSTNPLTIIPYQTESSTGTERILLVIVAGFLFVNFVALAIFRGSSIQHWLHFIGWAGCAIWGHVVLNLRLTRRDPLLFPIAMLLSGWGILIIDRLEPYFADRQTVWLLIATFSMLLTATFPYVLRWLRLYRYTILVLGITLLVSTILLGRNPSGQPGSPQLWLGFGTVYFQPSEVLKIILVAFLASYLGEQYPALRAEDLPNHSRRQWLSPRIFGPVLLMWGLCIVILVWQRDLGTAILFFAIFLALIYTASGNVLILIAGGGLTVVAAFAAYRLFDVVQLRIDIWLNPWLEADGRAYQIVQSLMAFASGSVFGQGIAQGIPDYIPVAHSDFVFAALAEEWGLLGVIALIACMTIFVMRGLRTAVFHDRSPFHVLITVGLSMLIGVQSLLIMGGVLKLIPLTGVTLPFLSYGGSSLLMAFVTLGLLLRLSAGER